MELVREILSLCLVFGLLGAALWWMRRVGNLRVKNWNGRRLGKSMESLERLNLTPNHSIHLVRVGEHRLVVAVHSSGCTVLDRGLMDESQPRSQGAGA